MPARTEPWCSSDAVSRDAANINVIGTLASVPAGGTMRVTFWAQNKGNRTWTPQDTRLVMRWIDFSTGTRRLWNFKWMRTSVAPNGQTRFDFDVTAPAKPGRYKLIYGLVRLSAPGADFTPPRYDAPQDAWPNEFAAIAFAVNVTPPNGTQ